MNENVSKSEVLEFIADLKKTAEKELRFREESARVWAGGAEESWRAVGCNESKAQRLETSAAHARIAVKFQRKIKLLEAVLKELGKG